MKYSAKHEQSFTAVAYATVVGVFQPSPTSKKVVQQTLSEADLAIEQSIQAHKETQKLLESGKKTQAECQRVLNMKV